MKIKKAWLKLIKGEIENPLTKNIEINRDFTFNEFGTPISTMTTIIKQTARVDDYGNLTIHEDPELLK